MLKLINRWLRKKEDGVVAIEFAMVALPLFTLIFGIIESSLYFAAGSVLEGGSVQAARMIRTGQVQESSNPEDTFKTQLCNDVSVFLDCAKLQYEVIHISGDTFLSASSNAPVFDSNGNLIPRPFDPGVKDSVVIVRSYYKWEFYTPYIGSLMTGSLSKNWAGHMSTVVIKSEPYTP